MSDPRIPGAHNIPNLIDPAVAAQTFILLERKAAEANDPTIMPVIDFCRQLSSTGSIDLSLLILMIVSMPPVVRPAAIALALGSIQKLITLFSSEGSS